MTEFHTQGNPIFQPKSPANEKLRREVAPPAWTNPEPADKYNLVVIGAGSGGLVTAAGAAGLGARVALIEREALGGDCLNVGCVPSKALLAAAKRAAAVHNAEDYGIRGSSNAAVHFPSVMERMRELRASIGPNDSAERFRDLGIDVFLGQGRFKNGGRIEVNGKTLKFSKSVIATGGRAIVLPIDGLETAGALTNETLFSLTELPKRFAVIGGGPVGCEMAQAFARLGSEVTLFESQCKILPREDSDAARIVEAALEGDGVHTICDANIEKVEREGATRRVLLKHEGETKIWEFDQILVGVGRAPNVEGMGLEAAGVEFDKRQGVTVNARLQTSNPRIYAVGDVALDYKFTHMADATARIVIQNALFKGRKKHTDLLVPWCTYTQPEIAHVGLYEKEAKERYGDKVRTFTRNFDEVDRSILEGRTEGFVRVHVVKSKIVGATIVGENAGEMISEISVAIESGMKLGALASVIHPYPTASEAIRQLGDACNRTRFTPLLKKLFRKWLAWTR